MTTLIGQLNEVRVKHKSLLLNLIKVIIAAGLIIFLIDYIDIDKIKSTIAKTNYFVIAVVVLLTPLNIYIQFTKWKIVCNSLMGEQNDKKIFHSLFYGFTAAITTPFRVGEYVGRAMPFKNIGILEITIATFVDKFFPVVIVLFIGTISAILFVHFHFNVSIYITLLLTFIFITIFISLYLFITNTSFWKTKVMLWLRNKNFIAPYLNKLAFLKKINKSISGKLTFFSFLFFCIYVIQLSLLIFAFAEGFSILKYFWVSTLIMFTKTFIPPFTFGEIGIREGVAVFFTGAMGMNEAAGFNAAILLLIINLVLPSMVGLILLFKKN